MAQSEIKKGAPKSILQIFRKSFASLQYVETTNSFQVDLAFAVILIEKLRHIIVHNGGRTADRNSFVELVAKEAGVFNNGSIAQNRRDFVTQFFGDASYENTVVLLEVRINTELPFVVNVCRFGALSGILLSYAHLLLEMVKSNIQKSEL